MRANKKSIPEFRSVDEEVEYWDTHSAAELVDEESAVEIDASKAREARDRKPTQQISLRFSHQVLERTRERANALGVPYQTLIQLWIAERLEEEEAFVKSLATQGSRRQASGSRRGRAKPG